MAVFFFNCLARCEQDKSASMGVFFVLIQCEAKKTINGTSPAPVTAQLPQMLSQRATQPNDRCHCPTEKVQSILSNKGP